MGIVIDTNVLLDFPQIVVQEQEDDIIILTDVLKELDGLKMHSNPETSFKARRAAVVISHNMNNIYFIDTEEHKKIPVDDKLIEYCTAAPSRVLITNDVYLKVKALIRNIETRGYGGIEEYTGVRTIKLAANEDGYHRDLEYILENHKLLDEQHSLREGEYVIIKNLSNPIKTKYGDDFEVLFMGVNSKGKIIEIPKYKNVIENMWINKIVPLNPEQECLFNALVNRDKTIIYAGGNFGVGKSFILNNFALQELERGRIDKIIYVPNNSYTENTTDLGALPGELLEKTVGLIGPLLDLIGIDVINDMIDKNQLEIVPINYIRGRNFKNSIVIVNEAQNLTEDHIKLLIARCGDGTRIFFDGDIKQTDSSVFKNKNGLKLLTQLSKSQTFADIFAAVKLITIERSKTANAASYLDEITGNI